METNHLFTAALGLSDPWYIIKVEFLKGVNGQSELHMRVGHKKGAKFEVEGEQCTVYDHKERSWRHLNFFQHECYLHAFIPRVKRKDGSIEVVTPPWAKPGSQFTLLFIAFALQLVKGGMPLQQAGRLLGIDGRRILTMIKAEVIEALMDTPISELKRIGIDETSTKKGHNYFTVVSDLDQKRVIGIAEGKGAQAVESALLDAQMRGASIEEIQVVTIDMSEAYIKAVSDYLPQAEVVHDRFHVEQLMNKAVDQVRRAETKQHKELKKTRYLWLKNNFHLKEEQRLRVDLLSASFPSLGQAYRLKELLKCAFNDAPIMQTTVDLQDWLEQAANCSVAKVRKVAQTIDKNWKGVAAYFKHLITNAHAERINLKIQEIKRVAKGYTNMKNFKMMIYFHLGKLKLPTLNC